MSQGIPEFATGIKQGGTQIHASTAFTNGLTPSLLQLFELFFPTKFVQDIMLPKINAKIAKNVSYGEFIQWIGLWFIMATTHMDQQ